MKEKQHSNCPVCGSKIIGRTDKKFCDDHCRSRYHQHQNGDCNKMIRNFNNRLRRNRKILERIVEKGKSICSANQLRYMGFDFSIHTSIYINEVGETCYYCYDRGYVSMGNDQYQLLKGNFEEWD